MPTKPPKKYDMMVIGAGSGGLSMGLGLHELGFKVLLVDRSDESIGGECLNNGCVPSKAFIHVSKQIAAVQSAQKFGLTVQGNVSLPAIWDYVKNAQEQIRHHENAAFFRDNGLDVVLGAASFIGKNSIAVNGEIYLGKKIAIATGSKPRRLQIPGVDQVAYYDNDTIWGLHKLPKRMLFIGAGPIGMELGQAFSRLGSEVVMVEMMDRILAHEDPDIAEILYRRSLDQGMVFHLGTKINRFTNAHTAELQKGSNLWEEQFDVVVVGIGRQTDFSELNLEAAGIQTDKRGQIKLDSYLRTSNKRVYVLGDAANGLKFSHAAELQATTIINNFFTPVKKKINYHKFSWVTFTEPEIATFGRSEKQLKQVGAKYQKLELPFTDDDRAITGDYQYGKLILLVKPGWTNYSDAKLLGGSMIAPHAGEMSQELILALSANLGIKSLFNKIYPYPTGSRVNKTIILNKYLEALKPWIVKLLKLIY